MFTELAVFQCYMNFFVSFLFLLQPVNAEDPQPNAHGLARGATIHLCCF